jgi:hypothetical protein
MIMNYKLIATIALCVFALKAYAQQTASKSMAASLGLYVFPTKEQTAETQQADEMACYNWAKEQTGFDPVNPTKVEVKQAETGPDGTAVRTAAKGAAAGAAIGAITGDAGQGAAVGAVVGGLAGRRARVAGDQMEQQQNTQAAAAQEQAMMDNFKKAFTACLEGKGYTVK